MRIDLNATVYASEKKTPLDTCLHERSMIDSLTSFGIFLYEVFIFIL